MVEDSHGFIYPQIDKKKCIECNLCKKVCPSLNEMKFLTPEKCYAAFLKDEAKREKSTSGGIASIIAENIIDLNGVVYGSCYQKGGKVTHIRIDNIEDIDKMKGSKYVHSYIIDTYKMVKNDLLEQKKVLFTGTPCQIAGLKKFLMKDYKYLYCVDIICHGVPSQQYLKDDIGQNINNIDTIKFRGIDGYRLKGYINKEIILNKSIEDSKYYEGFLSGLFLRKNCYSCSYAKNSRISDMTIGDFWGLSKKAKLYKKRKGISVVLPVTEKGYELFGLIKKDIEYEERDVKEAFNGNSQLRHPCRKTKKYDIFYNNYEKLGFDKSYERAMFIKRLKKRIKKIKLVSIVWKKIKGR